MSEDTVKSKQGLFANAAASRTTMLSSSMPVEPPVPMKGEDGTVLDPFKFRVAAQQFANENGPLFSAFAKVSDSPEPLINGADLATAIATSTKLAGAIAAQFTKKEKPSNNEIRPFRHAAAEIVANCIREGGLASVDIDGIAKSHAAAFHLVDEGLDRSIFADQNISDVASLEMTAATVTLNMMKAVMVYDFRHDRSTLIAAMSDAVLKASLEAAQHVCNDETRPSDRRSVVQTYSNRLSEVMTSVYERKARQVVSHLANATPAKKEDFARKFDPLPEILRVFKEWNLLFMGTSVAYARSAANSVGIQSSRETAPSKN
ncbi:hypothetical protein [Thalassospira xiamenensis]|uniref:Uncharacterized protein n=1 Tax=Thalassospira xiamenensis TaxID=220697 RepID=A0A285TY12_9PROT|nr:hypothetical protein [Thalassospira xiamenensis]SOC30417.1 hypothetical protein SAMN05428964_10936 [Thalassospira xiamenensis]